jgi:hypothetical protein
MTGHCPKLCSAPPQMAQASSACFGFLLGGWCKPGDDGRFELDNGIREAGSAEFVISEDAGWDRSNGTLFDPLDSCCAFVVTREGPAVGRAREGGCDNGTPTDILCGAVLLKGEGPMTGRA